MDSAHASRTHDRAGRLAGELRALRRRARADRHAYWFPLVLFGLITCGAIPFYLQGAQAAQSAPSRPALPMLGGFLAHRYLGYYWLVALLAGLLLTLLWYRRNARRVGLQTPARGYLITVAVLTGLAIAIPPLSQVRSPYSLRWLHHPQVLWPGDLIVRGTFPFVIVAAGLWVLAWAERSRALAVIGAAYSAAALLASLYDVENVLFRFGWNPGPGQLDLTRLPNVLLPALVLLAAGVGAFAVQRRHRSDVSEAGHPTAQIDETVHQQHRLGILTITAEAQRAEFGYLREALGLTPGNLSRHLSVLEAAGMVEVEKGYAGRRPRTWVRITRTGRAALAAELAALTELLRRHATPDDAPPEGTQPEET